MFSRTTNVGVSLPLFVTAKLYSGPFAVGALCRMNSALAFTPTQRLHNTKLQRTVNIQTLSKTYTHSVIELINEQIMYNNCVQNFIV